MAVTEWRRTTLGEACEEGGGFVRTGPFGSQLHQSDYVENADGIPVVMPKDMSDGRIDRSAIARIDQQTAERLSHHLLRAGDIVLSRRGDVGRSAWVTGDDLPALCGTGSIRIHPGETGPVRHEYLRYFMRSRAAIDYLEGQAIGATMPNLNAGIVTGLPLTVPPLAQQNVVAEILSSLEDLIENNRRRVELLEQVAQAIYREWFVHFRYPGHEDATVVDSPLGPIPEGWEVKPLGEVIDVDKGLSYKGAYLTEVGTPMANLKCFRPGGGFRRAGTKPYSGPFKPKHEIVPGDLIVANTDLTQAGTVIGSPALVPRRGFESGGIISHHLFAVRCAMPEMRLWLYQVFGEERFRSYARGVASGTTVLGFRPADLLSYPVAYPPRKLFGVFGTFAGHLGEMAEDLSDASEHLAGIRDLLLPRLVTGQIDVSELDLDALTDSVA
jgi:type I restriction enzyme S subunit